MVGANLNLLDNFAELNVTTHFGKRYNIKCEKEDCHKFRLGGTAINQVASYEGIILDFSKSTFRAFYSENEYFEGVALLSDENWNSSNTHCYITEYYDLFMEGKPPGWIASKKPIKDAHYLFINVDVLDDTDNLIKRYRVSPFTGEYHEQSY